MRVIFTIQGEGRGHLTQALALKAELNSRNVQVEAVVISRSNTRQLPDFFVNKIGAPIVRLDSPNFVYDRKMKGINIPATLVRNVKELPNFLRSVRKLSDILKQFQPKLIINFYEPLVALSKMFNKNPYPVFSVAHQYIFEHPNYKFPTGFLGDKITIMNYTKFTSKGSHRKYALSLYPLENMPEKNLKIIPPLLRKSITNLKPENNNFILVYLLNAGYLEEVIKFKQSFPEQVIHCFTDKADLIEDTEIEKGLWLHKLNDVLFLEMMSKCSALLTTAGFESIAEAMYLEKPAVMVPVKGHFEQFCNSRDAANAGAGLYSEKFNLNSVHHLMLTYRPNTKYKNWYEQNKNTLVDDIVEFLSLITIQEQSLLKEQKQ